MRYHVIALAGAWALLAGSARADDWKPARAPLWTKWGKAITAKTQPWPEYPRPQLVRQDWLNLNGLWDYAITAKGAKKPPKWDGKILVPFCVESALSGVGKAVTKDQHLWYRRTIEAPAAWKGQRVMLRFEAVDWETTVFVNGKELGTHRGGFDPFAFDVTDALTDGKGELVLRVWDPTDDGSQPRGKQVMDPRGIWYTAVTGIWQTVWLEPVPALSITGVSVTTTQLPQAGKPARVEVRIATLGTRKGDLVRLRARRAGKTVFDVDVAVGTAQTVEIPDAALWTPEAPHLYDLDAGLNRDGKVLDRVASYFAVRTITAGKDEHGVMRLLLNGKPLFQLGPLDQGWWPDGLHTPPSDAAMRYDLEVLKQFGFNMLRKHIKVEPSRLYYHCDRLGLLVWQDMPSGFARGRKQNIGRDAKADAVFADADKRQFRTELKAMIDHLRFFPCIVVWVPFNEGWGQHDTNDILRWVKKYDPTRLVDGPSGWTDRGHGDLKDIHVYPGPGMFPPMADRVSVLGEFGGLGLPLKGHLWDEAKKNWGYRTYKTKEELRENYRRLIRRLHPLIGRGLAAAVYTQTTDVEIEVNGLMTYDRAVIKFDVAETAIWHRALFGPAPQLVELLPTSEKGPRQWRYSLSKPADGWHKPGFNDSAWKRGGGGFGTRVTPGAVVRTVWTTSDIWLRQEFEVKAVPAGEIDLRIHHDEDAEVYLNGVLVTRLPGYVTDYYEVSVTGEARRALKVGKNVLAVHCRQTTGGQYIDAGLIEVRPPRKD